jgi:hypothetical protein
MRPESFAWARYLGSNFVSLSSEGSYISPSTSGSLDCGIVFDKGEMV